MVSYVNLKLPSQPTNMCVDHVAQGDDDGQEDWNTDYFGRTAKGKGKRKGRGEKGRKAKEETQTQAREDSMKNATGVKNWATEKTNGSKKTAYGKGRHSPD